MPRLKFKTYLLTLVTFLILDGAWLGLTAQSYYFIQLRHLLAVNVNFVAVVSFYVLNSFGLMYFVLRHSSKPKSSLISGALYGLFTYATYDLTNLALLRDWPIGLTVIDITWGMVASALTAYFVTHTLLRKS